jgi:hypothetical protein
MNGLEEMAMDLVNKILSHPELPKDRIQKISLEWIEVYSEVVPVLNIEFFEETET